MTEPQIVVDRLRFPEAPRWHEGRLWFSDMHSLHVHRLDLSTRAVETVATVAAQPSGLGWDRCGRLLVVSMRDRRLLRLDDDRQLREVADLSGIATHHCNDMVVSAAGYAYVGNMGFAMLEGEPQRPASIACVAPDGTLTVVADGLLFPNGMVISPDRSTIVTAESVADRLTAFTIAADGSWTDRRVWAQVDGLRPDGICLDEEGAIWVASTSWNELVRLREGGEIVDRLPMPRRTFACMLGGPGRRTLFACISESSNAGITARKPTGAIVAIRVDVPGAGLP